EAVSGHTQGKLPSQPEQAKAITTLRSGKIIDNHVGINSDTVIDLTGAEKGKEPLKEDGQRRKAVFPIVDPPVNYIPPPAYVPPIPFPGRLKQSKFDKSFSD
ncbi:hypothetical protein, partial [Escherichia coli]|uniref:hypothetical protein n=1 Tax=Escherichia coli TaxID=562 RepID=UPI00193A603E